MSSEMRNIAIIVGAGTGKRMGFKNKAFLLINKKPILAYSVFPFEKSNSVDEIILVVRKNKIDSAKKIVQEYGFKKIKKIISGGLERQDSVYNALEEIIKADYVLVHDITRPLVTEQLIENVIKATRESGAAIPAIPLKDTIKMGKSGDGFVEKTLKRDNLWSVQTPQAFRYEILKKAYKIAMSDKFYGTDDASLVERLSYRVKIIPGYFENIKITVPSDLIIAEVLLKKEGWKKFK